MNKDIEKLVTSSNVYFHKMLYTDNIWKVSIWYIIFVIQFNLNSIQLCL
jgi:hypothetical protein